MPKSPELKSADIVATQPMTDEAKVLKFERGTMTEVQKQRDAEVAQAFGQVEDDWKSMGVAARHDEVYCAGACPRCGNELLYRVSSWNGHRSIFCKTANCISVME